MGLIVLCCVAAPGCSVCHLAYRTVIREPSKYSTKADRNRSYQTYRQWAEQEWQIASASCSHVEGHQQHYAGGFIYGFVDYCRLGGNGEPPPVPPREYWEIAARARNGKERAARWFDGYRHGARVAMDGGYRQLATLQSSLMGGMPDDPLPGVAMDAESHPVSSDGSPEFEDLPLPNPSSFQDSPTPQASPGNADSQGPKTDEIAPPSQPNDVNEVREVPTSRRPATNSDDLNVGDALSLEDITRKARQSRCRSLSDPTSPAPRQPSHGLVDKNKQVAISNEDRSAVSSSIDSAVIRIVSAETNPKRDRTVSPPRTND